MSNALQIPAHLMNRPSRGLAAAAIQGIGGNFPAHISIKDNRFTLVDAAGNKKPHEKLFLDVVIVDVNPVISKIYYASKYDPKADSNEGPACYSDNGVAPSASAPKPQNSACLPCPHHVWGSRISTMTGSQTRACSDIKKTAVVVPELGDDIVFLFTIPPASLKNLASYVKTLGGMSLGDRPAEPSDVVMRVSFESQGVLKFEPVSFIDERTANLIDELDKSDKTAKLVGRDDAPAAPALAKPVVTELAAAFVAPQEKPVEVAKPVKAKKVEAPVEIPRFITAKPEAREEVVSQAASTLSAQVVQGFGMQSPTPMSDTGLTAALQKAFALPTT